MVVRGHARGGADHVETIYWKDAGEAARTKESGAPGTGALIVRLDPGDELHACVLEAARLHDIRGGSVSAIGAVDEIELGYFRLPECVYDRRIVRERVEVVALM